jgi:KDO2-lipid IV(A) lauroyltransferase
MSQGRMLKADGKMMTYRLEAVAARLFFLLLGALPIDSASAFGGWLARRIGPLTGAHRIAERNIRAALPSLDNAQVAKTLTGMWDNIGRTVAEYPHLEILMTDEKRVEIVDPAGLADSVRDDGVGGILIGMHFGNWELSTLPSVRFGFKQQNFYRAPNNPFVEQMLQDMRKPLRQDGFLKKSAEGARKALILLKHGTHIGMLADQKQNEGIAVPFFGRDAKTTTAPAAYARRLDLPIIADCVERLGGAKFRIHVAAIPVSRTANQEADIIETTRRINDRLESWIREHPEQWFWVHRRWPK